jgi:peroxiredoxin
MRPPLPWILAALIFATSGLFAQEPDPVDPAPQPDTPVAPPTPEHPATAEAWIGQVAPDFVLPDHTGAEHRLSDHKGKTIVLEWTSIVCPFVKRHYQKVNIPSISSTYQKKGVVWLAIDSSFSPIAHPLKVKQWIEDRHVPHPILLDPEGTVGEMFAIQITPTVLVIHDGKVVFYGAIDDDIWGRNKERRQFLMEALNAVLAGDPVVEATPDPYGMSVQYLSAEEARRAAREKAVEKPESAKPK